MLRKQLMSAFLALTMVLGLGSVNIYAAPKNRITVSTEDMINQQMDTRATSYTGTNWSFTHQRDTGLLAANAGQSISFAMRGVSSASSSRFTVSLCRYVINSNNQKVAQIVSGPIPVDSNNSNGQTITFQAPYTDNDYFIRCSRTAESSPQKIASVKAIVHG